EGQENPIVIEVEVKGHLIHRMYVDGGSASKLLYEHCFNRLRPEVKSRMIPATTLLLGFSGGISWPLGQISQVVSLWDEEHSTIAMMDFMIVRSVSANITVFNLHILICFDNDKIITFNT
nr:reverse transcriptase domain-containing protein [Tanacetum cinerariifolium]